MYCETERETFSEVTTAFNDKFTAPTEPVLLDLTGSNYHFFTCLLCPPAMYIASYMCIAYTVTTLKLFH